MGDRLDELVRIDATGSVHPVGRTASREMRRRAGDAEMVPSPGHALVLRSGPRDATWLAGEIGRAGVIWDLIGMLGQGSTWTGELVVTDGEGRERSIFFESGNVIGANSTADRERLGGILYHYGCLSEDQISMVLGAVTPEVRFGEAAVALGFLAREKLFEMLGKQTEEICYAVMLVDHGSFYFVDGVDPTRLQNRLNFTVASLMMEGVRRMDEMSCFRARIPSSDFVPAKNHSARISPDHEHFAVFHEIDGVKSIDDIGRALGMGQFDATRAVFQLMQSNLASATTPRPTTPVAIVDLFNEAISLVLAKVDEVGGGRDVREQLASFATASGVYDALFREAGPKRDGRLDSQRIADNIEMLVGREEAPKMLTQWLYEYATFAMFIAEPLLRSRKAKDGSPMSQSAAFSKHVAELLKPLAPD